MFDDQHPIVRSPDADSDAILRYLTTRQHVRPHLSILEVLDQTTTELGCRPQAIRRALDWLGIDETLAIGRLRRSELLQLSRVVHRFWTQAVAEGV